MLVLLVEDEPLIELVVEEIIRGSGHLPVTARTGQDALALFRDAENRPDAMVLDNRLPDMLGWDVAVLCRNISPDLPIVICSGDPLTGAKDLAGVVSLEKPYSEHQLLDALRRAGANI